MVVVAAAVATSCADASEPDSVPTSAPVLTTAPSEFTTTTTTIPPGPVLYTIQSGDTLSAVAAEFGLTLEQLLQANPTITDPGLISVGQTILIPDIAPASDDNGGLELPEPEEPDLPSLTSTTTTTEPLATTSTAAP